MSSHLSTTPFYFDENGLVFALEGTIRLFLTKGRGLCSNL